MKRLFALILASLLMISLIACGKTSGAVDEELPAEPEIVDIADGTVASFTDAEFRIRMEVRLPGRWEWTEGDVEETYPPISEGIVFYPKDEPEVRVTLACYPEGFGMCGTGVEFSELILREDLTVTQGVERLSDTPCKDSGMKPVNYAYAMFTVCFHDVAGSYVAQFELTTAQEAEYYDTIIAILATAQLGPVDAMRESRAIELAQEVVQSGSDLPAWDSAFGRYNWEDGSWTVNFYCAEKALCFSYIVDAVGGVYPCRDSEPLKAAE